ncbi:MAG TPA: DUF1428 domain-containing protein [Sphingomicrobium sp.]
MTYFDGFVAPVPKANRDAYVRFNQEGAPLFLEAGVGRHVEAWADDVPDGKVTDFRKSVNAKEDEDVVLAFFEYDSKATRDAATEKMRSDERMTAMGANMPFDGKRLIYGGFEAIVEEGSAGGSYADGFVVPVPEAQRQAYRELAAKMAKVFRQHGANRVVEAFGSDVPKGEVTDFHRAVKAENGEGIVFSFIEWPDKATRDEAWAKIMSDESLKPEGDMPFSGQRMFWGGFDKIIDTADARTTVAA